jgi:hypothetical protein
MKKTYKDIIEKSGETNTIYSIMIRDFFFFICINTKK